MPNIPVNLTPEKDNSLYWLGRYAEKTYLQLHNLIRCQELLDLGKNEEYVRYFGQIGSSVQYHGKVEARSGLLYDRRNTESVFTSIERANVCAAKLQDELRPQNFYYLNKLQDVVRLYAYQDKEPETADLQQLADWSLAFWGSVDERIHNPKVRSLLYVGKLVEHIVMCTKLEYKFYRIEEAFMRLSWIAKGSPELFDARVLEEISYLLTEQKYCPGVAGYRKMVLDLFDKLVKA